MEKIKILMVMGSTGMGGTQVFVLNLLRNLDLNRFQVDFAVNFEKSQGIGDEVQKLGSRIYFLPYFKVYNYFGVVKAWRVFLQSHHYDIVHGHSTNSASVYLKVAKEMGCATIAHSHSAGYRGNIVQQFMKFLFTRRIGKVADYWFACSEKAAKHLYGEKYREYKNYYDIPNAIDADKYFYNKELAASIRKKINVCDDEFLCGHVGTFSVPKNHAFLLEIFSEVLKLKPNAKLVCCGEGALMRQVKEKASVLGILDKIIFPGVVNNANEYLMAMDVLVFPSVFEGFGIAILEAEAAGTQVVMSNVIPSDVDLTDLVHRHSLSESPTVWAKTICELPKVTRQAYYETIAKSKYNMRTSIRLISSLYEEMIKKKHNNYLHI